MFPSLSLSFPIWKVEADKSPSPRVWHMVCYQSTEISFRNPSSILTLARSSGCTMKTNSEPGGVVEVGLEDRGLCLQLHRGL